MFGGRRPRTSAKPDVSSALGCVSANHNGHALRNERLLEGQIMTDRKPTTMTRSCCRGSRPEHLPRTAKLRVREKAHTREGDAIAAARRRLPMVEVDADLALIGPDGPLTLLDAFEGRRQLIAYYFMWHPGQPAAEQCEGCTWVHHPGRGAVLPSFPRHHLRGLLSGSLRRKHPLPRLHGLGHAVVLGAGLPRRAPRRAPTSA